MCSFWVKLLFFTLYSFEQGFFLILRWYLGSHRKETICRKLNSWRPCQTCGPALMPGCCVTRSVFIPFTFLIFSCLGEHGHWASILWLSVLFPWPDHVGSFYVESFKVITFSWWRFCFLVWKVLLPLCAELRNEVMQPMVLPMVLTIAESQVIMVQSWGAFIWNTGWYVILFVL